MSSNASDLCRIIVAFTDVTSEEIVKFRIFNIDPEFIKRARAEDPNVTVEQMVEMKIGVRKIKGTF